MNTLMTYKGYYGSIDFSPEDLVLFGKIEFIQALISYEGNSAKQVKAAFEKAVDDYLDLCKTQGIVPEVPCKGSFNVRIGNELHTKAALAARQRGVSLNEFVKSAVRHETTATLEHRS